MRKILWFWNIVHYVFYKFDYRLSRFINKYDPVNMIYKIPFIKNKFKKEGVNPYKAVDQAFKDPSSGISSLRAGGFIGVLTALIIYGLLNFYIGFSNSDFYLEKYHMFFIIGLSLLLNYFIVFKNDKYLEYFKEFKKMRKNEKWKWAWISLIITLLIITFFIYSIYYEAHRPW